MHEEFSAIVGFEIAAEQDPKTGKWSGLISFTNNNQSFTIAVRNPNFNTELAAEAFAEKVLADPDSPVTQAIAELLAELNQAVVIGRSKAYGGLTLHQGGLA